MPTYQANRPYNAALTARDYQELLQAISGPPTWGALWLILAPRRYGKTWTLKSLQTHLGTSASYLDLGMPGYREDWAAGELVQSGGHYLLDEISGLVGDGQRAPVNLDAAQDFLSRCERLKRSRISVVLALTPRELKLLQSTDRSPCSSQGPG